jgi:hypothetical protein
MINLKKQSKKNVAKQQGRKNSSKTTTHVVAKNINLTFRLNRQGYLTLSIPEVEIWREQQ